MPAHQISFRKFGGRGKSTFKLLSSQTDSQISLGSRIISEINTFLFEPTLEKSTPEPPPCQSLKHTCTVCFGLHWLLSQTSVWSSWWSWHVWHMKIFPKFWQETFIFNIFEKFLAILKPSCMSNWRCRFFKVYLHVMSYLPFAKNVRKRNQGRIKEWNHIEFTYVYTLLSVKLSTTQTQTTDLAPSKPRHYITSTGDKINK